MNALFKTPKLCIKNKHPHLVLRNLIVGTPKQRHAKGIHVHLEKSKSKPFLLNTFDFSIPGKQLKLNKK